MHLLRCCLACDTVSHLKRATLGECKKERMGSAEGGKRLTTKRGSQQWEHAVTAVMPSLHVVPTPGVSGFWPERRCFGRLLRCETCPQSSEMPLSCQQNLGWWYRGEQASKRGRLQELVTKIHGTLAYDCSQPDAQSAPPATHSRRDHDVVTR
jgi:hypothetical protein